MEIIIAVAILLIIATASYTIRAASISGTILSTSANEVAESLKLVQVKSLSRYKNSQWGVYFKHNTNGTADQMIMFKGSSYATRDTAYDLTTVMPTILTFINITLTGNATEVEFTKSSGKPVQTGTLQLKASGDGSKTISINSNGVVDIN